MHEGSSSNTLGVDLKKLWTNTRSSQTQAGLLDVVMTNQNTGNLTGESFENFGWSLYLRQRKHSKPAYFIARTRTAEEAKSIRRSAKARFTRKRNELLKSIADRRGIEVVELNYAQLTEAWAILEGKHDIYVMHLTDEEAEATTAGSPNFKTCSSRQPP
ncbi:hypothetical protein ACROYT_G026402 [Oculina patagonica]